MLTRPSISVCLCLAVLTTVLTAQDPPAAETQDPTFRSAIQSVRVDLYATRDGEPVYDLRPDEVQLFEDGIEQTIQTFERVSYASRQSAPSIEPPTPDDGRRLATNPRTRLFVVFLPTSNPTLYRGPGAPNRVAFVTMINELLGPDDLVALMTPGMHTANLTFRRQLPDNEDAWFDTVTTDPKHHLWDACYPPGSGSPNGEMKARYQELMTFEALDALVAHLGALREERKHVLVLTNGFRLYTKNPRLVDRGAPGSDRFPIGVGSGGPGVAPRLGERSAGAVIMPRECQQDLADLASLNHTGRLDDVAAHAQRTNVSFFPVSLQQVTRNNRGLRFQGPFENATVHQLQSSLRALAEDTDGVAILSAANFEDELRRVITTTSSYYLLGYTSTNSAADTQFRRISVNVSRPGLTVRARPGYVAMAARDDEPDATDTGSPDAVTLAMRTLAAPSTNILHVRPATWVRRAADGGPSAALWVVAELDPDAPSDGVSPSAATAELTLKPVGAAATLLSQQAVFARPDPSVAFRLLDTSAQLEAGNYSIQIQVAPGTDDAIGEFARVTVPETPTALGEALLLRRGPATGPRYQPTAVPRFRRDERVRLELPTDTPAAAAARLLDGRGAELPVPLQVTRRDDDSGAFRWIVVDVPLLGLAPADYAVEVALGGTSRVTAFRLTP